MWSWLPLLLVTLPVGARAQAREEAVRFQYRAPEICPTESAFVAQVRERTERGRWASPEELARTFVVEITPDERGFVGRIELVDDAGAAVSRSVRDEQCEGVVSSLALITALALDATLHEEPASSPEPTAPPASPASPPPASPPPPIALPAPGIDRPAPAVTSVRLGFSGGYAGAEHAPSLGLLGQLDFRAGWSLRLSVHYGWDDFAADPQGRRAKLRIQGIETSVCPGRYLVGELAIAACGLVDLGYLHVAGVKDAQLTTASSDGIFWGTAGAELRLGWEPPAPYWAEARVGGVFPLRQGYRFTFENPSTDVYLVPVVAASAGLAVGVRFW